MVFDEYQVNRPENRLIKATLLKLLSISRNAQNTREIRQLLYSFELVNESVNYPSDFSKVSLTRGMKEYGLLIQWAKIFLLNKSFTTFSGKNSGKALLFPMEQVFEAFIAKKIKSQFERQSNGAIQVTAQDRGYYLFDDPQKFRLRPDLVVRNQIDEDRSVVVMDTKWKLLNRSSAKNYGISQSDMYQMYAYSKKYHTPNIWLIYPLNDEVRGMDELSFEAFDNETTEVTVNVFFFDLDKVPESLQSLYQKVFQE